MTFSDEMTLADARVELRTLIDHGHKCPLCTRYAKVYLRTIHATMARELITFWRVAGREWFDMPDVMVAHRLPGHGDAAKLRYWRLVEPDAEAEPVEGAKQAGIWRVTELGEQFVLGRTSVPKYARVYDGRRLGMRGEPVTIIDCLGDKFDYRELMSR